MCTIQTVKIPSLNVAIVEKDEEFHKSFKEFYPEEELTFEELPSRNFHKKSLDSKYAKLHTEVSLYDWSEEVFESLDTEKRVIEMRGLQKPKHACVSL